MPIAGSRQNEHTGLRLRVTGNDTDLARVGIFYLQGIEHKALGRSVRQLTMQQAVFKLAVALIECIQPVDSLFLAFQPECHQSAANTQRATRNPQHLDLSPNGN